MKCPYCDRVVGPNIGPREWWPEDLITCEHVVFHFPPATGAWSSGPMFPDVFRPGVSELSALWAEVLLRWIDPEDDAPLVDEEARLETLRSRLVTLLEAAKPADGAQYVGEPRPPYADFEYWRWLRWKGFGEMMLAEHDPWDNLDLGRRSDYGSPESRAESAAERTAQLILLWCLEGFRRGREYERVTWEKWTPPTDVEPPEEGWDFSWWDEETPVLVGDVLFRPSATEAELTRQDALAELRFVTLLLAEGLRKVTRDSDGH